MDSDNQIGLEYFIIIADRKRKDELVELLGRVGARTVRSLYGKGSVKASAIMDAFGFVTEENKIILSSLLPSDKSAELMDILENEYSFSKPNTGIAFAVPVEGLSF